MLLRTRIRAAILPGVLGLAASMVLASCEGSDAHVDGPKGASALDRLVVIGTGLSMGVQSGGVLYESQVESWPAQLTHAAGVNFRMPLLRAPGCQPPLIAPLQLSVYLSGVSSAGIDSSCAGLLDTLTPPAANLAIAGATAYAALNLTPKVVLNSSSPYGAMDRARYQLVLASTQSQVTALRIQSASFVAIELGLMETLPAVTSGLDIPATSYKQTTPFTNVPAGLFSPVFAAIADSVKLTGARVVVFVPPHMEYLYGLRPASDIWADRAELATFGVNVSADCSASANFVFTPSVVPPLAASASSAGSPQNALLHGCRGRRRRHRPARRSRAVRPVHGQRRGADPRLGDAERMGARRSRRRVHRDGARPVLVQRDHRAYLRLSVRTLRLAGWRVPQRGRPAADCERDGHGDQRAIRARPSRSRRDTHGRDAREPVPIAPERSPRVPLRDSVGDSSSYIRDGSGTSGFRAAARSVRDACERLH